MLGKSIQLNISKLCQSVLQRMDHHLDSSEADLLKCQEAIKGCVNFALF